MIRLARTIACALGPAIGALGVVAWSAAAQTPDPYPSRELHVISAFPPNRGADVWLRFFAEQVRARAGQPVLVENRPGANGNTATEYLARAKPDGYTILIHAPTSIAANKFMLKNTPADLDKSIVTVATLFNLTSRSAQTGAGEMCRRWSPICASAGIGRVFPALRQQVG